MTIPNAVDLERCESLAGPAAGHHMRRFVPAGTDFILMSVGRLEQNKGFHVLAEALASLRSRSWYWVIVGDGPARPQLEQQIATLGLTDHVRLMGRTPTEDLHAWYEASDLFVHPTLYEGSSLVTLEAMAHRRAVVATTAGGLPDKVIPGRTGWLVPPGDATALDRGVARGIVAARQPDGDGRRGTRAGRARVLVGRRGGADDRAVPGVDPLVTTDGEAPGHLASLTGAG